MDIQTVLSKMSDLITNLEETVFKNRIELAHNEYIIEKNELTIDKLQLETASNYTTIQRLKVQNKKLFKELKTLNQITNMENGYGVKDINLNFNNEV